MLKRKGSINRTEATQQPAPFEKKPHPEREDLEFLEAMREMDVRRAPWGREAPTRRENAERVRFLAENEEQEMFMERMERLEVRPLNPGNNPGGEIIRATSYRTDEGEIALSHKGGEGVSGRNGQHLTAAGPSPSDLSSTSSPALETAPFEGQPSPLEGTAVPGKHTGPGKTTLPEGSTTAKNDQRPPALDITRFEITPPGVEDPEPAAAMEALMDGEEFDPSIKFAGALTPPTKGSGEARRRFSDDVEPDEELDLHGKTQEEAIRMVQNFLLVSHRQKLSHVLIITGKGKNSGQAGPVLGRAVFHWLERNGAPYVRDFIQAPPRMGGDGAIWITLR